MPATVPERGRGLGPALLAGVAAGVASAAAGAWGSALALAAVALLVAAVVGGLVYALLRTRQALQAQQADYQTLADSHHTQHSEALRLRKLVDALPVLISYVDRQEIYRFTNAAYDAAPVIQSQSLLGHSMREVLGPKLYPHVEKEVAAALRGEPQSFDRGGVVNGLEHHFSMRYVPDIAADGRVQGFYIMLNDITAARKREALLAERERRVSLVMDNLPMVVAHIDPEGRYSFANAQFQPSLGINPLSVIGRTVDEVARPDFAPGAHERIRRALQGEASVWETSSHQGDGIRHFFLQFVPDTAPDGSARGVYAFTVDITARKLAELALAQQEHMLRTVTDNLPVFIAYFDQAQRVQFLNATGQLWTRLEGNPLNRHLRDLMRDMYDARLPAVQRVLRGERVEFEVELQSPVGLRLLHQVLIPDIRPDGSVAGAFTLGSDVTDMKATQQQLVEMARSDMLTGLPNRRHFDEQLQATLLRHTRDPQPLALMFLDVDHFKAINDSLGHAGGDAVLREFADRLRTTVRGTDLAARLAGDEFVVLLEGIRTEAEAALVAQKTLAAMRVPFLLADGWRHLTTSIGVAFVPHGPITAERLLARADEALYGVKHAGRNGWQLLHCTNDTLVGLPESVR